MVKRSHGWRRGTRHKLKQRGRLSVSPFLQRFKPGQQVIIVPQPSSHSGMPHPRFKGRIGVVVERRGRSYVLELKEGGKVKRIIASPEHLKLHESTG